MRYFRHFKEIDNRDKLVRQSLSRVERRRSLHRLEMTMASAAAVRGGGGGEAPRASVATPRRGHSPGVTTCNAQQHAACFALHHKKKTSGTFSQENRQSPTVIYICPKQTITKCRPSLQV